MRALDLLLPGDPATPTGGYVYDRRILEGLGALGWGTRVLRLGDGFPCPAPASLHAAEETLAALPAGRIVVVDGLALAELASPLERHAARLRLVALVHHPVGDETGLDEERAARLRREEQRAWNAARGVIVTSRWTRRRLAADGFPAERIRVVEPGTDRPRQPPPEGHRHHEHAGDARHPSDEHVEDVRHRLDVHAEDAPHRPDEHAEDPPRLLCVATLTPRKGHAVLLDALAHIADRAWRLDCIGSTTRDPATAAEIRDRIERRGLARRVALHGEVSAATLDACYRSAHAFVLPSYLEGYGMALADALAHGVPIVGTNAGATPDTVGDAGLLVPPGDIAGLAAALASLLDDDALHAALAGRAQARGRALPTWAEQSARFAAAVEDLAGTSRSTAG